MQRRDQQIFKRTTAREIERLCQKIACEFHPEKIILFGSHAYGKPQLDSDVDLLVIMPFKGTGQRTDKRSRSEVESKRRWHSICSFVRLRKYQSGWRSRTSLSARL